MARVVVCGAGTCGLITAMLLADDGHEVVVVERDPMEPPAPADAWEVWERRGVNQFRLAHFLMSRFRYDLVRELPRLIDALAAAGAYEFNFFGPFRDVIPDPERFDVITARRPVLEAVVAEVARQTPRVEVRRGVGIASLTTGTSTKQGIPHVTGVVTESGETIAADVVVAATGRRSPLSRWLVDAGARAPYETEEDSGFVYYGRYMRSSDGTQAMHSPHLGDYGSIGLLALPADHGTVGVGIISFSGDAALRTLRHEEPWRRVFSALPGAAPLVDLEPMSDIVAMGSIEDRYRRFVVDGEPVATGVFAVADAWAATNPTLGRGISLGVKHAILLRDHLRAADGSPYDQALAWDDVTEREMTPWYDTTVWHDRHKVAEYIAAAGAGPAVDDDRWVRFCSVQRLFQGDLDLALRWVDRSAFLSSPPNALLDDPEILAKIENAPPPSDHDGPTREQLLELAAR
ncbi:MAG TPA: NAD(P)/FAD-dependent oxidoreductase [Acidimicrobiales bacterium]|nr:NAD(P)/FAD-dependent oxidoreductase [Acidimicrobiales bacterium]